MSNAQELYHQLESLKTIPSKEAVLQTVLAIFENQPKKLLDEKEQLSLGFDGQSNLFYEELAHRFVKDLEKSQSLYFLEWYYIFKIFSKNFLKQFFEVVVAKAEGKDIYNLVYGLQLYYDKQYGLAIINLDSSTGILSYYCRANAYYFKDDYGNSIQYYKAFIDSVENTFIDDFDTLDELSLFEWIAFVNIGNCYTFTKRIDEAILSFNDATELFSLEESYNQMNILAQENKRFKSSIFVANYLKVLSKSGNPKRYNQVLDFAQTKFPDTPYFSRMLRAVES